MKTLFGILLAILVVASIVTWKTLPSVASDAPVLYWVTDPNPARTEQIRTFRKWLADNGHPDMTVLVDTVNLASEKVLVQGVSGVCGDLLDHTGGAAMRFRQAVGLLEDVTEWAEEMGFDVSKTFAVLRTELTVDGRQFAFPSNVSSDAMWVNVEAFENVGMERPPKQWTFEEFEEIGREFVKRANANEPGSLRRYFFLPDVDVSVMARTMGGAIYNETQSACVIDSEGYRRALGLRYKWTYEDRLLPTTADKGSFAALSGYGGVNFALFAQGNFAMVRSGRWASIAFRKYTDDRKKAGREPLKLAVSEDPYGDFRCSVGYTRATAMYAGGKQKDLAKYFMAYLASEEYNMNIVIDGDALPPNPVYTKTEEFLRPKDRPEEWQHPWGSVHETFVEIMGELGISPEFSPFVLDAVADRYIWEITDKYMNNMLSLEAATAHMQQRINEELQRSLQEDPGKVPLYEERVALQKQIDELRARGELVPLSWIANPYWRYYYTLHKLADETK